uniref:Uncharacterized protein n=1 Tax=Alexandrium monilatum TaxID=311494 RepID=A0A7S4UY85_9DINO
MSQTRPGVKLLALGALCGLADLLRLSASGFVSAPRQPQRPQVLARGASAAGSVPAGGAKESSTVAAEGKTQKDIDDAVLQMAMAMTEEEEKGEPDAAPTKKKEEGLDFNLVITFVLSAIVFYSVGSSIISIATGRIQDRSGGDFTLYDFFDNIFSFKDWSLEYTLGFDPFKVAESLKGGSSSS